MLGGIWQRTFHVLYRIHLAAGCTGLISDAGVRKMTKDRNIHMQDIVASSLYSDLNVLTHQNDQGCFKMPGRNLIFLDRFLMHWEYHY